MLLIPEYHSHEVLKLSTAKRGCPRLSQSDTEVTKSLR